jgi:hypothetical protein
MSLKKLNFPFMPFGGRPRGKGAQVAPLAGARIFLAGMQPILSGW